MSIRAAVQVAAGKISMAVFSIVGMTESALDFLSPATASCAQMIMFFFLGSEREECIRICLVGDVSFHKILDEYSSNASLTYFICYITGQILLREKKKYHTLLCKLPDV